jgi:uncharacterized membrane protein
LPPDISTALAQLLRSAWISLASSSGVVGSGAAPSASRRSDKGGIVIAGAAAVQAVAAPKGAEPASGAREVSYPANLFDNGKARHFQHKAGDGTAIRYFVIKSTDGVIRAAFDACDVCWREGKGYVQKDDVMVCRNCGMRFPSAKINEVTGGCNPVALTRRMEGGKVIIGIENILQGKRYFAIGGGRS